MYSSKRALIMPSMAIVARAAKTQAQAARVCLCQIIVAVAGMKRRAKSLVMRMRIACPVRPVGTVSC